MGKKTYEISGYESEMIKPKELIEIKEATEILLALYAPQTAYALTSVLDNPDGFIESFNDTLTQKLLPHSEAIQLKLGGLICLCQPR